MKIQYSEKWLELTTKEVSFLSIEDVVEILIILNGSETIKNIFQIVQGTFCVVSCVESKDKPVYYFEIKFQHSILFRIEWENVLEWGLLNCFDEKGKRNFVFELFHSANKEYAKKEHENSIQ